MNPTTIPMPPPTLGQRGVGLSGPIGATIDGTTATGTVDTIGVPGIDWPALDVGASSLVDVLLFVVLALTAAQFIAGVLSRRR